MVDPTNYVLFKAEGSNKEGLGHISRCVSLIKELPSWWGSILMVNQTPLVQGFLSGLHVNIVYSQDDEKLRERTFKYIFFDQQKEDVPLLEHFKAEYNCTIVGLDYFNYSSPLVDIIINLFNHNNSEVLVNRSIKYYEGLKFAVIGPRFKQYRRQKRQVTPQIKRVLIMMGGADPGLRTCNALNLLNDCSGSLDVTVVIGPLCEHEQAFRQEAGRSPHHITFYKNPPHLPELMANADIAISGCATTFFELSFLGTPAIVLSQNEQEARFCSFLEEQGLAVYGEENPHKAWNWISKASNRKTLTQNQMHTFDGMGQNRILEVVNVK